MVSLNRITLALIMSTSWVAGCATIKTSALDLRLEALCALTEVNGRLDVTPAGPGSLSVRIVTLDRPGALTQLNAMSGSESRGIAKVRVEAPRPLLAFILRLGETNPAISAALAWSPVTISIGVSSEHPDIEELERWSETNAVPLLVLQSNDEALPQGFQSNEGSDLRGAKDINKMLVRALSIAEQRGAAWIYGALNRPTLEAIRTFISQHGDTVHVVGFEHITQPPTTPRWRRRCVSDSD